MPFRSWNSVRILLVLAVALVTAPIFANPPKRFIQVEQEGNLGNIPEDARGNFFAWYEPVEYDDALVEKIVLESGRWTRIQYRAWRRIWPSKQSFDDLAIAGKIRYLELLAEKRGACQRGVPCPLLVRREKAPAWLARHPYFEARPGATPADPASFWYPEITTDRDLPAMSPAEALRRHREVIANTGLDSPHFHVFVRIPRTQLLERREALFAFLQRANDDLFLAGIRRGAGQKVLADAMHNNLRPWTEPVRKKLDGIIEAGKATPHPFDRNDEFDPKRVNLALRYWGESDGIVLLSLEFRGLRTEYAYPPKGKSVVSTEGMEPLPKKVRSFAALTPWLDRVWTAAGDLLEGTLAAPGHVVRRPDLARMEAAIAKVATAKGVSCLTYAEFIKQLYGLQTPTAGLLMPFSDRSRSMENPALKAFVEGFVDISAEMRRGFHGFEYHNNQFFELFERWTIAEQRYLDSLPKPGVATGDRCKTELYEAGRQGK